MMTSGSSNSPEEDSLRKSLASLDIQRKSMEQEADAIYSELSTPPDQDVEPMGLDTPLVDKDGYPRGDIDVYRARTLRGRFRTLQTDHKEIVGKIETLLYQLSLLKNPNRVQEEQKEQTAREAKKPKPKYDPITGKWVVMNWDGSVAGVSGGERRDFRNLTAQVSQLTVESSSENNTNSIRETVSLPSPPEIAFARVNAVANDSPANEAGLQEEDLIVKFGNVDFENNNQLKALASLVPDVATRQGSIIIKVKRGNETLDLTLKPRPWSGRGLLGCHIVPYLQG